ncbi:MAG: hydrogenase maturation nickel metallochaperone HypA [Halothiobacillaceae bacterium]
MHEMSLCESIVQIIEEQASVQQFKRVRRVILDIGALSSVDVGALRFCFDLVAAHGVAQSAEVEIHITPAQAWCVPCATRVDITQRLDPCPLCGSHQVVVEGGDDMCIKELEVD